MKLRHYLILGVLAIFAIFAINDAAQAWTAPAPEPNALPTQTAWLVGTTPQPTATPPSCYTLISLAENGDTNGVIATARQMIAAGKNSNLAYQVWALTLLDNDRFEEAYQVLSAASEEYPREAWFPYLQGQAAFYLGEYQIAREYFRMVIELGNNPQLMGQSADWFFRIEEAAGQ